MNDLYSWPADLQFLSAPLHDLSFRMDLDKLAAIAATIHDRRELTFAIVSKEYLRIGRNWVYAMRRLGLRNFLIIAGDQITADTFDRLGVPNVHAQIDETRFSPNFVSSTGFSGKGLAVSAFKFPVTAFLVDAGYHVIMSDADALWLQDAMPYVRSADIAFQRIVYHPPELTSLWGFAACGGFLAFRSNDKSAAFLDDCISEQKTIFCDQISINLALLEHDPVWTCPYPGWTVHAIEDTKEREAAFDKTASLPITGVMDSIGAQVLALPHHQFWRHPWVKAARHDMVVCHPNSPKDDFEKMDVLRDLDLEIDPI